MAYGRKAIPPPATPFEELMATTSERMIAAKVEFIEFLRELPPAAYARRVDQGGAQGSRCCDAPPVGGGRRALAADVLPRLHADPYR